MLHIMTRQVFHATLKFNHATSGKKMRKGNFILLSGAKFYEVNYPISELLRKMKRNSKIYTTYTKCSFFKTIGERQVTHSNLCHMSTEMAEIWSPGTYFEDA